MNESDDGGISQTETNNPNWNTGFLSVSDVSKTNNQFEKLRGQRNTRCLAIAAYSIDFSFS